MPESQPNYLTVTQAGGIGANFRGHVRAAGLDIEPAEDTTPPDDRKIRWIRESDGFVAAWMTAQPSGFNLFVESAITDPDANIGAAISTDAIHDGSRAGNPSDRQSSSMQHSSAGEFMVFGVPHKARADAFMVTEVVQGSVNDGALQLHSEAPFGVGTKGVSYLKLSLRAGADQQNDVVILDAAGNSAFRRDDQAMPQAMRYSTAPQNIGNATWTALTLNGTFGNAYAQGGAVFAGGGGIQVPRQGIYMVQGQAEFAAGGGARRIAEIVINSNQSRPDSWRSEYAAGGTFPIVAPGGPIRLNANDIVELWCWQDSGAAMAISGGSGFADTTKLAVCYIGSIL